MVPSNAQLQNFDFSKALDINMSKIMKRRTVAMVGGLETMKELEYWKNFFFTWFSSHPRVPESD